MKSELVILAAGLLATCASSAEAQFRPHVDLGGYTYRTPSTTYMYRYNSGATYNRFGNYATYSANNGTRGYSLYRPNSRFDSFSNPYRGWSGSGISYYRPPISTYQRTYYTPRIGTYRSTSFRPFKIRSKW